MMISGAGGGGGGKGGGGGGAAARSAVEDPDTLQSKQKARVLDLISEGEILGFPEGESKLKYIYLDETPIESADGTVNFTGVTADFRYGTQDQTYIPGFEDQESEVAVGVRVQAATPVVRQVTNADVEAVRVTINVPALTNQDTANGDLHGATVEIAIDVQASGGSYVTQDLGGSEVISGKTRSKYERAYRINLTGAAPWNIRVRRITADSTTANIQDQTWWGSYTEIIPVKFTYPNSALAGLEIDSSQFSAIPTRAYLLGLTLVKVPSNYDPETRVYTGIWDGTFQVAWTDSPAWCYYDIMTNTRYGLGDHIPEAHIDKWALYTIGKYCDELVPDGKGGTEPRFTLNVYLQTREAAYKVIADLASAFRGMAYWAGDALVASQDAPSDPVALFTTANVIGEFNREGSGRKARHTVAVVQWNDPSDFYRLKPEFVDDPEGIAKLGIRTAEAVAFGCSSQGQAHRVGKWILYTEKFESEVITFRTGLDATYVRPGQIVKIVDPDKSTSRHGGRVIAATAHSVTVDAPVVIGSGEHVISIVMPDLSVIDRVLTNSAGTYTVLTFAGSLPSLDIVQAVWVIATPNIEPELLRVLAITEDSPSTYRVAGVLHYPGKFAAIEGGIQLEVPPTSDLRLAPDPVTNVDVSQYVYVYAGRASVRLVISFEPSPTAATYRVSYRRGNDNWTTLPLTSLTHVEVEDVTSGDYEVQVTALNNLGLSSTTVPASYTLTVAITAPLTPTVTASVIDNNVTLSWTESRQTLPIDYYEITEGSTYIGSSYVTRVNALSAAVAALSAMTTTYWVVAQDTAGYRGGAGSATIAVKAPLNQRLAARPNLCEDVQQWTMPSPFALVTDGWGLAAQAPTPANGTYTCTSPRMACIAGEIYTITGDSRMQASSGSCYFDLQFYDSSGTLLLDGPQGAVTTSHNFTNNDTYRDAHAVQATAPTGAVTMAARFVVSTVVSATSLGFRQVKVEQGALPATIYTTERQVKAVAEVADVALVAEVATRTTAITQVGLNVSQALDEASSAAEAALHMILKADELKTRAQYEKWVTDATVEVDPLTGTVNLLATATVTTDIEAHLRAADISISAIDATVTAHTSTLNNYGDRIDSAEASIGVLEGEILLKASSAYVDSTVAEALGVLDPEAIAASAQTSAEGLLHALLDAANSRTGVQSSAVRLATAEQSLQTNATALQAEAVARQVLAVQVDSNLAATAVELSALATADEALATSISTVQAATLANAAAITTESSARTTADAAEAAARSTLAARVTTAEAAIITEQTTRASADSSEAATRSVLAAKFEDRSAGLTATDQASAEGLLQAALDAGSAKLAAQATTVKQAITETTLSTVADSVHAEVIARQVLAAQVDTAVASIVTEQIARTAADSALASSVSAVTATLASTAAALTTESTARVTGDAANATSITTLAATVAANLTSTDASIATEASARAAGDSANASSITTLAARVTTAEGNISSTAASLSSESSARAAGDSANASDITTLAARVTTAESNISSTAASLSSESSARASGDSANASSITTLAASLSSESSARAAADSAHTADIATLGASISSESSARVTGDAANASAITTLAARVTTTEGDISGLSSSVTTEASARAAGDSTNAGAITTLASRVTTAEGRIDTNTADIASTAASVTSEASTRASGDSANASAITTLAARVTLTEGDISGLSSSITSESSARATGDSTNASAITTLASRVTTAESNITANAASVTTEATTRAAGDAANATLITTVQARLDSGDFASVKAESSVTAGKVGGIEARYILLVDGGGNVAGMQLAAGTGGSSVTWLADKFLFRKPDGTGAPVQLMDLGVVDGVTTLSVHGNLIVDGSIITRRIGANAVTNVVSAEVAGSTSALYSAGLTTVCSVAITSTGAPIYSTASLRVECDADAATLGIWLINSDLGYGSGAYAEIPLQPYEVGYFTLPCSLTPPAGTHTYYLVVQSLVPNAGDAQVHISRRNIFALETKR